jgi:hypothetical protein
LAGKLEPAAAGGSAGGGAAGGVGDARCGGFKDRKPPSKPQAKQPLRKRAEGGRKRKSKR